MTAAARTVRGGVFALEPEAVVGAAPATGPFAAALAGRGRFLATSHARGALEWLVGLLDPPRLWLPAYLCGTLVTGALRPRVSFFPVDDDLAPIAGDWLHAIEAGDLAVAIAYFGWPPVVELAVALRERGARVVVDASQALLTEGVERGADYVLASPRKFVGVPDGGLLVPVGGAPWPSALPALPPWSALETALAAGRERLAFDRAGGDGAERGWYRHFAAAESAAPDGPRAMSEETATRLARGVHWPRVARARRANWLTLAAGLDGRLLYDHLPDGVVPFGCALRFDSAAGCAAARAALREASVLAPWHEPPEHSDSAPSTTGPATGPGGDLASRVLVLPCDQRYDEGAMSDILAILAPVLAGSLP